VRGFDFFDVGRDDLAEVIDAGKFVAKESTGIQALWSVKATADNQDRERRGKLSDMAQNILAGAIGQFEIEQDQIVRRDKFGFRRGAGEHDLNIAAAGREGALHEIAELRVIVHDQDLKWIVRGHDVKGG